MKGGKRRYLIVTSFFVYLLLLIHEKIKKMVTYFNKKDLVAFGNYLLSDERRRKFKTISNENLEERLSVVHHADVENFLTIIKNKSCDNTN